MNKRIVWTNIAWQQFIDCLSEDRRLIKRINDLIRDICRNGMTEGIGKPEILKYRKAYSRRISEEHRLVYTQDENGDLLILSCKGRYK